ncbi:hypothetical protein MY4824_001503 [Beauveria thailandica]
MPWRSGFYPEVGGGGRLADDKEKHAVSLLGADEEMPS